MNEDCSNNDDLLFPDVKTAGPDPETSADSPFSTSVLKVLGLASPLPPKYSPVVALEDRWGEDKDVSQLAVMSKPDRVTASPPSSSFGFWSWGCDCFSP